MEKAEYRPSVKVETFANEHERLRSTKKCLSGPGYILVRGIPVEDHHGRGFGKIDEQTYSDRTVKVTLLCFLK